MYHVSVLHHPASFIVSVDEQLEWHLKFGGGIHNLKIVYVDEDVFDDILTTDVCKSSIVSQM